jgi:hypothetical protein
MGENKGQCIINLTGGARIFINGNGGTTLSTGTISVTNNSAAVTGSTAGMFTGLVAGNYIRIGLDYHQILSVNSSTSITLVNPWRGRSRTGLSWSGQAMILNVSLRNLTISRTAGAANPCVFCRGAKNVLIEEVDLAGGSPAVLCQFSSKVYLKNIFVSSSPTSGIVIQNCYNTVTDQCITTQCITSGIIIEGASIGNTITGTVSSSNGVTTTDTASGIDFRDTSSQLIVSNCSTSSNNGSGVSSLLSTTHMTCKNCISHNNGLLGLDPDGAYSLFASNNVCFNNDYGFSSSTQTIISQNVFRSNAGGVLIFDDNDNIINNNIITLSTSNGVECTSSDGVVINSNLISGSTGNGVVLTTGITGNYVCCKNIVLSNTISGINIPVGSNYIVYGNRSTSNSSNGINLAASDVIAVANNLRNNTGTNLVNTGSLNTISLNKS